MSCHGEQNICVAANIFFQLMYFSKCFERFNIDFWKILVTKDNKECLNYTN